MYMDIDTFSFASALDPQWGVEGDGNGDASSLSTRLRYIRCFPFFLEQCTRRELRA